MNAPPPVTANIEHAIITSSDLDRSITLLQYLFGWHGGHGECAHIGSDDSHIALRSDGGDHSWQSKGEPLSQSHNGIAVIDPGPANAGVQRRSLTTYRHVQYAPGPRRFTVFDRDGIAFEAVSYA